MIGVTERARREDRAEAERFGDGVIGKRRHGDHELRALRPSAHVQHHVVADVDAPFPDQSDQAGEWLRTFAERRVEQQQQLASLVEVLLHLLEFLGEEISGRPGDHDDSGVVRNLLVLGQCQRLDGEVVALEQALRPRGSSVASSPIGSRLAVALDEIGLALLHRTSRG